jgi:DNA-binding MarR family transcriptional regulator
MTRKGDIENLYQGLTLMVRRSRELSADVHPGLSLVAFTLLTHIQAQSETRAADVAAAFGLDKSTVSRSVDQLVAAGLLRRAGERPGRRGQILQVTPAGNEALASAADSVRAALQKRLADWDDDAIATFVSLVTQFNSRLALLDGR